MADKPIYYGSSSQPSYGGKPAYYGKGPTYYGKGAEYYGASGGTYGSPRYGGSGGGADDGSIVGTITIGRVLRVVSQRWLSVFVFLLVGLWHGAEAHFLLWGLYNGVVLAVSALLEPVYQAFRQRNGKLAESRSFYLFRVLRTFAVVNIGWFFDRCARAGDAVSSFLAVVTGRAGEALLTPAVWQSLGLETSDMIVLGLSALLLFFASLATERGACIREKLSRLPWFGRWIIITAGVVTVLLLGIWGSGFKEAAFLYYQF